MKALAEEILAYKKLRGPDGNMYNLNGAIDQNFGEHLQKIVHDIRPQYSIEIGLAYGISSLYLCEALTHVGAKSHTIIDPYQHDLWHGAGLHQLDKCGYGRLVEYTDEHPHTLFPRLLEESGEYLDFCFIDGPKRFDIVMVNAFCICKMLRPGGVIYFDDVNCLISIRFLRLFRIVRRHTVVCC